MRLVRRFKASPAMVVACLALLVALTGTSVAAVTQLVPRNSVGTAQLRSNAVTSAKVRNGSLLRADFRRGQIPAGPRGPAGPAGTAGAAGAAGPAGPAGPGARWALVRPDGGIVAQSGGITFAAKAGLGRYILNFGSAITGKLIVASNAVAGDTAFRGTAIAGPCGGGAEGLVCPSNNDTNHVFVITTDTSNGAGADHAFYVAVIG